MGACGSKDARQQRSQASIQHKLSRWEVAQDESHDSWGGSADEKQETNLTLNTVAAYEVEGPSDDIPPSLCVAGWEDGVIRVTNWKTKAVVKEFSIHSRSVNRVEVGPRSGNIYSCSRDTTVSVLRRASVAGITQTSNHPTLRGHTLNVSTICVDEDETSLCSGGRDTQTIMWDIPTATCKTRNIRAQNVITCSKWIPGERTVAQGSEDLSIKLWDERNGLRSPVQTLHGYIYFPLCIDVSPDGHYLLTSSKGFNGVGCEARIWDRRTGKQLLQFDGHQQDATACSFVSSHGSASGIPTPVTGSKDASLKVWDTVSGELLCEAREPLGHMFTSISPASSGIILASTFHGDLHALKLSGDNKRFQLQQSLDD